MLSRRTLLTLCPSPSTLQMLQSQSFSRVRLWPRGVDLSQFSPSKRSPVMRSTWGVGECPGGIAATSQIIKADMIPIGEKTGLMTPPDTPWMTAVGAAHPPSPSVLPERTVLLYVGRV